MQDLEIALLELHDLKKNIVVLCLSEHFIKKHEERYLNISGFYLADIFSREDQRRGGSCILCNNSYESTKLDIIKEYATEKHFEISGIVIKKLKLIVLCIYRTPNSDINVFLLILRKFF